MMAMKLWEKWKEQQKQEAIYPERIKTMWKLYGQIKTLRCKDCQHFYKKQYSKTYFKCDLNRDTQGPATDWRANWPACGRINDKQEVK